MSIGNTSVIWGMWAFLGLGGTGDPLDFQEDGEGQVNHETFFEPERCAGWEASCPDPTLECERPDVYVAGCDTALPPDVPLAGDWPGIAQNECFIAASPRDAGPPGGLGPPPFQVAAWRDFTRRFVPAGQGSLTIGEVGFAMSYDDGVTWSRCSDCCLGAGTQSGHNLTGVAFADCPLVGHEWSLQSDPAVAIDGRNAAHMLLLLRTQSGVAPNPLGCGSSISPYAPTMGVAYARSTDAGESWETVMIPGSEGGVFDAVVGPGCVPDKCLIGVNRVPGGDDVYVAWSRSYRPAEGPESQVLVSISNDGGDGFLSGAETPVQISQLPSECESGLDIACKTGVMPAVGPNGEAHVIWNDIDAGDLDPPLERFDRVNVRSVWGEGVNRVFVPPLGFDEQVVFEYNPVSGGGAVQNMLNAGGKFRPHVAADATTSLCGRGGKVYIVFNHEEFTDDDHADSNIYVVRSLSFDPVSKAITWSEPVRVNDPGETMLDCSEILEQDHPFYRNPVQFAPAIAVDDDGRVGVMWYDDRDDSDRCDANNELNVYFSCSLDGGRTFSEDVRVTDVSSQTSPLIPGSEVGIMEYIALAASDNAFHLSWTDFRNWNGKRASEEVEGDIFTSRITVSDPVISMGDVDGLGGVGAADYDGLLSCLSNFTYEGTYNCETVDFDQDGDVDKTDVCRFFDCGTGVLPEYPAYCRGQESQGGGGHESGGCVQEYITACHEELSPGQKSLYAEGLRGMASAPEEPDAEMMTTIADGIDPQE